VCVYRLDLQHHVRHVQHLGILITFSVRGGAWLVWQRVAACCGVLQCVAVCCSALHCVAVYCTFRTNSSLQGMLITFFEDRDLNQATGTNTHIHRYSRTFTYIHALEIAHCNILQHTATHCNTLQQHTAAHCNTLQQHTATQCNTLQLCVDFGSRHVWTTTEVYIYVYLTLQHSATRCCNTLL